MTGQFLLNAISDFLTLKGTSLDDFSEFDHADVIVNTFKEAGVLSNNDGIVISIRHPGSGRQKFQLVVHEDRRGGKRRHFKATRNHRGGSSAPSKRGGLDSLTAAVNRLTR